MRLALYFLEESIKVVLVLDNHQHRHHSKKSTITRDNNAEIARIDCIAIRKKIMQKVHQLKSIPFHDNTRDILEKELSTLQKNLDRKEKIVTDRLRYKTFFEDVSDASKELTQQYPSLFRVVEAVTQADCVICYEANKGDCDGSIASDGDFVVNSGRNMLLIKDFKMNKRTCKKIVPANFTIASSHLDVISHAVVNVLNKNADCISKPNNGFNLLETNDHYLRAVIALGTGCDALPGGIKTVGISTIQQKIRNENMSAEELLNFYSIKSKIDIEVLRCYMSSIMFEPGDTVESYCDEKRKYINDTPQKLPLYCKEFAQTNVPIDTTLGLTKCKGCINNSHMFLKNEPSTYCK